MQLVLTDLVVSGFDGPWSSPPDLVKDIRLILVQEGYGLWTVDQRTHLLRPNDLVFLKPGQLRYARMFPKQPIQYLGIRFSLTSSKPLDNLPPWLMIPSVLHLSDSVRTDVDALVSKMKEERAKKELHYLEVIDSLAKQLFVLLARAGRNGATGLFQARDVPESKRHPGIEKAIEFIHNHMSQTFDIGTLADVAGLSPSVFRRLFRKHTGYSPQQYVIKTRMWHARELLSVGDFYIYEVAAAVGYEDSLYFSRVFRQTVGVSPKQYRARQGR